MSRRSEDLRKKERMEITLSHLVEYYATAKQVKGCSKKTLIGIKSNLGKFIKFLERRGHSLKLADLTIHDARAYVASLQGTVTKYEGHTLTPPHPNSTFSPQTVHTHVRALRAFSNWLYAERYTKAPIFELLDLPKLPQTKIEVLSPEEIQKVLATINPDTLKGARLLAMVLLLLDTGIRAGEMVGMKLADVDWNRGVFKVFGKGSKERFVPIGATTKQALLRYVQVFRPQPARDDVDNVFFSLDGYPLSVNAIVRIMSRLAKNSGVTRLHAHLLRHTCGVQYLVGGGDTKSLQMFLGHASPFMTHHYEQFKDEHMLAQHRKFSPVDRLGVTYRRYGNRKAVVKTVGVKSGVQDD
ncbi:MAG: tyrosine-type recombinase/integrase [Chloroflexi bacterium]|nr:tyrosine-type recombinase/integrase [Chloroflexota bacterium]